MMKCPYCHKETDEQAKVCPNCKAAIPRETNKDAEPLKVLKRNKKESDKNGT